MDCKMITVVSHNIISPLGATSEENYRALMNGASGITLYPESELSDVPLQASLITQEIMDKVIAGRTNLEDLSRLEQLAILSIERTIGDLNSNNENLGFVLSSTKGNVEFLSNKEKQHEVGLAQSAQKIADYFGFKSEPVIVSNACISGVAAFAVAKRLMNSGMYDKIVIAGVDVLSKFIVSGFQSFQSLSPNPCKPYDANRDGLTLGEGVGSILLEKTDDLSDKVEIVDATISNDANHISGPSRTGEGLYRAIHRILDKGVDKPDMICAHGTATRYNDDMESIAIKRAGLSDIPVFALKGYYGHTLGAAGVIESIISIMAMTNNQIIGTKGTEKVGVVESVNIAVVGKKMQMSSVLKVLSGFGGCNAAVYFRNHA